MAIFRKTTLREVAQRAGVSPTTVSEFLSGRPYACSPETATRIREAVEELHYIPSALGTSLRKAATRTIGVSILFPLAYGIKTSYLYRIWDGVTREAFDHTRSVLFYDETIRRSLDNYRIFLDGRVDGVIFHPAAADTRPIRLAEAGFPVAVLGAAADFPGCAAVMSDEKDIVHQALTHLWELGHRRIAHLAGPIHSSVDAGVNAARGRMQEWRAFLEERGAWNPELLHSQTIWDEADVSCVARWRYAPDPPTAIFCANDAAALRVLDAAAKMGWRVPQELSVVGVDNTIAAEMNRPGLTSVEYPIEEQGRAVVRALLERITGTPFPLKTLLVGGAQLMVRETTASPPS